MKTRSTVFTAIVLLLLTACGGGGGTATAPPLPEGSDLRVDVNVKKLQDGTAVSVQFYYSAASTSGNQNTGAVRHYVAVENPTMNGVAMVQENDGSGRTVYRAETSSMKSSNVITATYGGRNYEATAQVPIALGDRVVSTMLKPK